MLPAVEVQKLNYWIARQVTTIACLLHSKQVLAQKKMCSWGYCHPNLVTDIKNILRLCLAKLSCIMNLLEFCAQRTL